MTVSEVMAELELMGNAGIKKILLKHGVKEPLYGVKVEDLKTIEKKVKKDYQLAKDLYATGNTDAMYLAGLIADDVQMTKDDLNTWVQAAVSNNISEYTVPWVAAGSKHGMELAMEWIDSKEEYIAAAGWSTLSGLAAVKADSELDIATYKSLLQRVAKQIQSAKNRERYAMNGFVIAVGSFVKELSEEAINTAGKIGDVAVDMNGTACQVPDGVAYINKVIDKGYLGKKKKKLKC